MDSHRRAGRPLPIPAELDWVTEAIGEAETSLDEVVGRPRRYWKNRIVSPEKLLRRVAARLCRRTGLGIILNISAIIPCWLRDVLTRRELIELVPYDNRLLRSEPTAANRSQLLPDSTTRGGSLVIDVPTWHTPVLTTDYLAQKYTATPPHNLSQAVLEELTAEDEQ